MGVESEHLKNVEDSISWYEKAYKNMDQNGFVDDRLYQQFKKAHQKAQDNYISQNIKNQKRKNLSQDLGLNTILNKSDSLTKTVVKKKPRINSGTALSRTQSSFILKDNQLMAKTWGVSPASREK